MDSFDEAFRKSQEAGERLKKALEKGKNDKSIEQTLKVIERTESKLEKSKEVIKSTDNVLKKLQKKMETAVDKAVQLVEAAIVPQKVEPGFKPHLISPTELSQLLKDSKKIVFLTGSGICQELGLPVYRGHNFNDSTLKMDFENDDEEEELTQELLLTSHGFVFNRKACWKWISDYYKATQSASPTKSHLLLNELAEQLGREGRKVALVTENIDNYHQEVQAKSKKSRQTYQYPIYGMHGNIGQIICFHCSYQRQKLYLQSYESYAHILEMQSRLFCPSCEGPLHPNVKFHDQFYKELYNHSQTIKALGDEADVIVVIGSPNESQLTNHVITNALAGGRKVVEIGSQCIIQKVNIDWAQAPSENVLELVKQQINIKK